MSEVYHAVQLSFFNVSIEHLDEACFCNGKPCTKCSRLLCVKRFNRHSGKGLQPYCRQCQSEERKSYYQFHAEEEKARKRAYYREHPEKRKSPEENRQDVKRWKQNHPEAKIAEKAQYRAHLRNAGGSFTAKEWKRLKAQYNHACLCCGKQEPEIQLTPDHVVPLVKGGNNTIENIQPLCLSCNSSKREKTIDFRDVHTSMGQAREVRAHEGVTLDDADTHALVASYSITVPFAKSTGEVGE